MSLMMNIETAEAQDAGHGVRYRYIDPHASDEAEPPWLTSYTVHRMTPKGCWIVLYGTEPSKYNQKFVLDGHGKRYAYPTKEEALESYIIRKERQVQRSAATHDRAKGLLALAKRMQIAVVK
jgi:hypothetical protein